MAETFGIGSNHQDQSQRSEEQQEFVLPQPGEEQSLVKKKTAPLPAIAPVRNMSVPMQMPSAAPAIARAPVQAYQAPATDPQLTFSGSHASATSSAQERAAVEPEAVSSFRSRQESTRKAKLAREAARRGESEHVDTGESIDFAAGIKAGLVESGRSVTGIDQIE